MMQRKDSELKPAKVVKTDLARQNNAQIESLKALEDYTVALDSALLISTLAQDFLKKGDKINALENFQKHFAIISELYRNHSEIDIVEQCYKESAQALMLMFSKMGGGGYAIMLYYDEFLDLISKLVHDYPNHREFKHTYAQCCLVLSEFNMGVGDQKAAETLKKEYFTQSKDLFEQYPSSPYYKNGYAQALVYLSSHYNHNLETKKLSEEYFLTAINLWKELRISNPDMEQPRVNLDRISKHFKI
jgi:hypothetical protein